MSAETLRRAAALMRERAETAAASVPAPWRPSLGLQVRSAAGTVACWDCCGGTPRGFEGVQEHIASWHPAVALAVADWLDLMAVKADVVESAGLTFGGFEGTPALAVARTYLGEEATS